MCWVTESRREGLEVGGRAGGLGRGEQGCLKEGAVGYSAIPSGMMRVTNYHRENNFESIYLINHGAIGKQQGFCGWKSPFAFECDWRAGLRDAQDDRSV